MEGIKEPYELLNEKAFDPVTKPEHYTRGSLECIEWIRLALTEEEYRGYLKGCILKYFWRYEDKGKPIQDLEKLRKYAEFLIDQIEREEVEADILEENERCTKWLVNNDKESMDGYLASCKFGLSGGVPSFGE